MNTPIPLSQLKGEERKQALAKMPPKQQVAALLADRKADIQRMLPSHLNAERLLKVATIAATTTPALLECEVPSLITAVGQCAMFGLEPNTILGHAYMVPFKKNYKDANNNWKSKKLVQVIIGYKGLIDLARRSGQIISISAHEVCEHDEFDFAYGLDEKLIHRPADSNRGAITHFYAYAKLKDGGTAFEVMSTAQVNDIRDKAALKNGAKRERDGSVPISGPWKDHYVEMGRKTAIRRLAKYLPLSVEFQKAAALDEAADAGLSIGAIEGEFTVDQDADPEHTMGPGAEVDTPAGTGFTESTSSGDEPPSEQGPQGGGSGGPIFEDAMAAIKSGDLDMARDIARSLPNGQRQQIDAAISNASGKTAEAGAAKPAARRGRAGADNSAQQSLE